MKLRSLFCATALLAPGLRAAESRPPNIVFILADDIGYGEISCYGQKRYQTPNIDGLAREGMRFNDFYAGAPECAPSRCCLMTGLHPGHARIRANFSYAGSGSAKRIGLQTGDVTIPETLAPFGYTDACIGKWGLGEEGTPGAPWAQGFPVFYGFVNQTHAHNYYPEFIYDGQEKVALPANYGFADKLYIHDTFTTRALDFISQHRQTPFFLYLAYTLPHGKLSAPDDALLHVPLDLSDGYPADKVKPSSPVFAAMVRRLDRDVGRVLAELKSLGLDQRTLVIFTSDNGPAHAGPTEDDTVDVDFFHSSGPLRGEKSDVYEGGIRVPFIARWPGRIAPGTASDDPLAFWDVLPTLDELAGAPIPPKIDGLSFAPSLLGRGQPQHPYLYWEFISKGQPRIAVREGRWKADKYGMKSPFELYDLDQDLGEAHNVAADHPDIAAHLADLARAAHIDSPDFPLRDKKKLMKFTPPLWQTLACCTLGLTALGAARSAVPEKRPNILLILADDMGYGDIGCFGSEIATPNLDRLASQGLRFSQFYTTPKCFPSRASILTGLYPHQVGMGEKPKGLKDGATIAQLLLQAGYHTWMSGKWHDKGDLPVERGFEHSYGLCDGATNYFNPGNQRPGEPPPAEDRAPRKWAIDDQVFLPYTPTDPKFYTTDAFADQAIKYLRGQHDDKPFFLYLAFNAPHYPLQAWPEDIAKYLGKYEAGWDRIRFARYERQVAMGLIDPAWVMAPRSRVPENLHRKINAWEPRFWDDNANVLPWDQVADHPGWDRKMAVYAAMIDRLDQDIGRVLQTVRDLGKDDNTLIIFLSDNGGSAGSLHFGANDKLPATTPPGPLDSFHTIDGPWADVSNVPFRFYKDTTYEGGISTPTIFRWPAGMRQRGEITHQQGHVMDLLPTCLELAGVNYPATFNGKPIPPEEGRSLVPILEGKTRPQADALFWEYHGNRAMRQGPWKLVSFPNQPWELYNMVNDRTELYNLAGVRPDVVADLDHKYRAWAKRVGVKPLTAKMLLDEGE